MEDYRLIEGIAEVTAVGIRFENKLFSCGLALRASWFEEALLNGPWEIEIYYDEMNATEIYIEVDEELEPCYLLVAQAAQEESPLTEMYHERMQQLTEQKKASKAMRDNRTNKPFSFRIE